LDSFFKNLTADFVSFILWLAFSADNRLDQLWATDNANFY